MSNSFFYALSISPSHQSKGGKNIFAPESRFYCWDQDWPWTKLEIGFIFLQAVLFGNWLWFFSCRRQSWQTTEPERIKCDWSDIRNVSEIRSDSHLSRHPRLGNIWQHHGSSPANAFHSSICEDFLLANHITVVSAVFPFLSDFHFPRHIVLLSVFFPTGINRGCFP